MKDNIDLFWTNNFLKHYFESILTGFILNPAVNYYSIKIFELQFIYIDRVNVPIVVQFVVVPMSLMDLRCQQGQFLNILTHTNWNMFYLRNHTHFYHEIHQIY